MTRFICTMKASIAYRTRAFWPKLGLKDVSRSHMISDFGELVAASKAQLPSVVNFRLRNMAADHVNRYLEIIVTNYQERLEAGAVISVTERQIRVRTLPITQV